MKNTLSVKVLSLISLLSILLIAIPASAQRRNASAAIPAKPKAQAKASCSGGWRGTVTLTKTLKDSLVSDEPGIRKAMDRIKHRTSRNYEYTGRMVVQNSDPLAPQTNAKVQFSDIDKKWGEERVFDTCNSRENGHWFIIESTDDRSTTAKAEGPAKDFNLTVNEASGTYSFNARFPDAEGEYLRVEDVKRSGHCQPKNNEPFHRDTKDLVKLKGESFSVYGEKLDPDNPNRLSGTKIWGDDGKGSVRTFVFKLTWTFTKCPDDILVSNLRFEHMKFPTWDDWREIVDEIGTIDGNLVRIKADVVNLSGETKYVEVAFKETYKGDHWNGSRPDYPLHESVSVRLEPGETREVEVLWNSQGFAWFDDGRPRTVQRVKVEAWESYKKRDEMTRNLKVSPKPLVLVAGLWTDLNTLTPYQNYLTTAHSYGWKAVVFDDNITGNGAKPNGNPRSVYDYADALERKVRGVQQDLNAWHVDVAGHSTGGLIARLYVHKFGEALPDGNPRVKHLMLMGTPNLGIACTGSLVSEFDSSPEKLFSAKELYLEEMARFNQFVVNRHGTRFSAFVGRSGSLLCAPLTRGDGVVEVDSATAAIENVTFTTDKHAALTDVKNFTQYIRAQVVTGPRGTYPLADRRQ